MGTYLADAGIAALIPDMNGHGESGGDRYHVSISRWIEDIRRGIDYLGTRGDTRGLKTAAFGVSTGGTAVIETALVEPRIDALILLAPTVRNMMTPAEQLAYYVLLPFGYIKKYLTGRPLKIPLSELMKKKRMVRDDVLQCAMIKDPAFLASYLPIPGAHQASIVDTVKRAGAVRVPTLVMHGEDDEVDRPDSSRRFFEGLRCDRKLILLPETGHLGCVDRHRSAVYEHTAEWIRRCAGHGRNGETVPAGRNRAVPVPDDGQMKG